MQHLSLIETLSITAPLRGDVPPDVDPKGDGAAFSKVMQEFEFTTDPQPKELSLPDGGESAVETDTSDEVAELDVAKDRNQTVDVTAPELAKGPVAEVSPPAETARTETQPVMQTLAEGVESPPPLTAIIQSDFPKPDETQSSAGQVISESAKTDYPREKIRAKTDNPLEKKQTEPLVEGHSLRSDGTKPEPVRALPLTNATPQLPISESQVSSPTPKASPQRIIGSEAFLFRAPEQPLLTTPAPTLPGDWQQAAIWHGPQFETAAQKQPNLATDKFGVDGTALRRPAPDALATNQTVPVEPQDVVAKPAAPVIPALGISPSTFGIKSPESERSLFNPLTQLEIPIAQTTPSPAMDSATPRVLGPNPTAVVQNIAQQMAVSVRTAPDGMTELRLAPVELGRVEMRVATTETGVLVQLAFDRADTQDLVRRHIGDLPAEFRQMGLRDIGLAFAGQGGGTAEGRGAAQAQPTSEPDTNDPEATPVADQQPHSTQTDGLDLRL